MDPHRGIPVEEAYNRFNQAMSKAAHAFIPRGVRALYIPCVDEETQSLLAEYEKSGDPDIADQLIESLDAARQARCEESNITDGLYPFKQEKLVTATLARCRSASPPHTSRPSVSANAVAVSFFLLYTVYFTLLYLLYLFQNVCVPHKPNGCQCWLTFLHQTCVGSQLWTRCCPK